jgi:hypothetical protein
LNRNNKLAICHFKYGVLKNVRPVPHARARTCAFLKKNKLTTKAGLEDANRQKR